MKKISTSKAKKICVGILAVASLLACGIGNALLTTPASANVIDFTGDQILTRYNKGAEVEFPQEISVSYQGKTYSATNPVLIAPDGNAVSTQTAVSLNEAGNYTIVYTVTTDQGIISAEKDFTVVEQRFEVTSQASKIEYGTLTKGNAKSSDGTIAAKNGFHEDNTGIILTLADGDTFYYNTPFNLSDYSTDIKSIIEMWPQQLACYNSPQVLDAAKINVTLTDCYNPNNYVTLQLHRRDEKTTIMRAFASGQQETSCIGVNPSKSSSYKQIYVKDYWVDRTNLGYGDINYYAESIYNVYYGDAGSGQSLANGAFEWRFDNETKVVSIMSKEGLFPSGAVEFVTDLDNQEIYENSAFEGFTTGEVYLSISASGYNWETTTMEIKSIFGQQDILQSAEETDDTAPEIKVLYTPTENNCVYAVKGSHVQLFDAIAKDINLVGSVKKTVYYNYGTEYETKVPVIDNIFTPKSLGEYVIVYTAQDANGKTATQMVSVIVVSGEKGISLQTEQLTNLTVGAEATLPIYQVQQVNAGAGFEMSIVATSEHDKQEIDATKRTFTPLYPEEYTITYIFSDNVYADTYSYTVDVSSAQDGATVMTSSNVVVPRYFMKDMKYTLEPVYAYTFVNNAPKKVLAKCAISYDGGNSFTDVNPNEVTISGDGEAIVKYYYGDAYVLSNSVKIVKSVEGNSWIKEEYLQGNFTKESFATYISYKSNIQDGDNTLEFINAISLSSFVLEAKIPEDKAEFEGVKVTLYDYYDRTKKAELHYFMQDGILYFCVENGWQYRMNRSISSDTLTLKYNSAEKAIKLVNGESVSFDFGFTSDKCLMDITLTGIYGLNEFRLMKINEQAFSSNKGDSVRPDVDYEAVGGNHILNEIVTISALEATDVLSTVLRKDMLVTVQDPNGAPLVSEDGVTLTNVDCTRSYEILLSSYGIYKVTYTIKDTAKPNPRVRSVSFNIYVRDYTAPTVTFKDGSLSGGVVEMQAGTVHKIKEIVYSDDITAKENLIVRIDVYDQNYLFVKVAADNTFVLQKGTYHVQYHCYDAEGNLTRVSYQIVVV